MKNLKRVLSMMLVVIMIIGVMATASAVTYTDGKSITYKAAVSMLSELGVLKGMPDGSYAPTAKVTRAQAAKMVCVILNKGLDTPELFVGKQSFSDVPASHWAYGYISFGANLDILAGQGAGKFNPEGNVTGQELAKIMLVAMGYDAATEGFTGLNWALNVNVKAATNGLYAGLENFNPKAELTREQAAQIIYNALFAEWMVEYDYNIYTGVGKAYFTNHTLAGYAFGVVALKGVVVANQYADLDDAGTCDEGETALAYNVEWSNTLLDYTWDEVIVPVGTTLDDLGLTVTAYVKLKPGTGTATVAPVVAKVYGSVVPSEKNIVETYDVVAAGVARYGNWVTDSTLATSKKDRVVTQLQVNYENLKGAAALQFLAGQVGGVAANGGLKAGNIVRFVQNELGINFAFVTDYSIAKVGAISAAKEQMTFSVDKAGSTLNVIPVKAIDFEAIVGYEDLAVNDYVLIRNIDGTYFVDALTKITDKITAATKVNSLTSYTIADTKYRQSDYTLNPVSVTAGAVDSYVYNNFLFKTVATPVLPHYAVVTGAAVKGADKLEENGTFSVLVNVLYEDGTKTTGGLKLSAASSTSYIDKVDGTSYLAINGFNTLNTNAGLDAVQGWIDTYLTNHLFTYALTATGIRLTAVGDPLTDATHPRGDANIYSAGTKTSVVVNSTTFFFYKTVPTATAPSVWAVTKGAGIAVATASPTEYFFNPNATGTGARVAGAVAFDGQGTGGATGKTVYGLVTKAETIDPYYGLLSYIQINGVDENLYVDLNSSSLLTFIQVWGQPENVVGQVVAVTDSSDGKKIISAAPGFVEADFVSVSDETVTFTTTVGGVANVTKEFFVAMPGAGYRWSYGYQATAFDYATFFADMHAVAAGNVDVRCFVRLSADNNTITDVYYAVLVP